VVLKEALKALADGLPRLVRISPTSTAEDGIVDYTMTCHSGGTLDIYIEPVLPKPHIVILGRSPVAQTLCKLAKTIGYSVSVVAPGADAQMFTDADSVQASLDLAQLKVKPQTFIVVSTQGESDEEALEAALRSDSAYVAFVASKPKARKVIEYLRERGLPPDRLEQLRAPAGLDIHASTPEEIAVSVLAEIVQTRKASPAVKMPTASPVLTGTAKDPICGMTVDTSSARHRSDYLGDAYYFCCEGCKQAFEKDPAKYATASVT
jgi:xanthine dehydrogenase accessory factor